MEWIIFAGFVTVILFFILGFKKQGRMTEWKLCKKQIFALIGLLLILPAMFVSVPTGHTGILTTFGRVEDKTLEAGMHFKLPYQEVVSLDNRTQKQQLNLSCFSSDIQEIEVVYSINYQIRKENAQSIYKTIGKDYFQTVVEPRILGTVKAMISKYDAENLVSSREDINGSVLKELEEQLSEYNIIVVNSAIENMSFSAAFTQAVEEKQIAVQNKLKAETEQSQKTFEKQQEAERNQIQARSEADIAKIQAEAEKEVLMIQADAAEYAGQKDAAINNALAASLTETLLKYYEIRQWNGELPQYYVTSDGTVLPILGSIPTDNNNATEAKPTATEE